MSRTIGYVSGFRYGKRVDVFTADGTFTPPAGVTYAIAHIRAAGGGVGSGSAGAGGNSSVAFAGGTITATGGALVNSSTTVRGSRAGATNGGQGAMISKNTNDLNDGIVILSAGDGAYIVAGGAVTSGTGIAVVVGSGGTAGTSGAAGGSGYVWIEYEQPVGAGL